MQNRCLDDYSLIKLIYFRSLKIISDPKEYNLNRETIRMGLFLRRCHQWVRSKFTSLRYNNAVYLQARSWIFTYFSFIHNSTRMNTWPTLNSWEVSSMRISICCWSLQTNWAFVVSSNTLKNPNTLVEF